MPVLAQYQVSNQESIDPGPNNRCAFTTSTGATILVFSEKNDAGDFKIKLYRMTGADKATKTLLASFDPPAAGMGGGFTAAIFANDSVGIVTKSTDKQKLRYTKVNSSDWSHTAWETVHDHSGEFTAEAMDMDISVTNAVFVCWLQNGPTDTHSRIKMRDITGGNWQAVRDTAITDGPLRKSCEASSIVALGTGSSASVRNVVFVHGVGKAGIDHGVQIYTAGINEDTGAVATAASLRATYVAGDADAANTTKDTQRNAKLFRGAGDEFLLGIMHRTGTKRIGVMKGSYDNGTWTILNQLQTSTLKYAPVGGQMAITCRHNSSAADAHTINFCARGKLTDTSQTVFDTIAKIDDGGIDFSPDMKMGVPSKARFTTYFVKFLAGGGNRNLHLGRHELYVQFRGKLTTGNTTVNAEWAYLAWGEISPIGATGIVTTVPGPEGVADSANPDLVVKVDDNQKYAQARQKVQWQFATASSFASGTIVANYLQPDTKFKKVEGTDTAGVVETFTDTLPDAYSLTGGTYYMRVRMVDEWGNLGDWTTIRTIFVIHPPVATAVSPSNGVFLHYGDGDIDFVWNVTDSSPTDYQTAYQLQVLTNAGAIIYNSGKVTSTETNQVQHIDVSRKDELLYWIVKPWDTNDTPGNFSEPAFFTLTDPPSATIVEPDPNEIVETGMPDLIANMVTSGGRKIKQVIFAITKGAKPIWSIKKTGSWNNGEDVTVQVPQDFLSNNTKYSVQVTVLDTGNLSGVSGSNSFTVAWVPPPAPTTLAADEDTYYGNELVGVEPGGYVNVTWSDVADDDFYSWNLYRKDDLINPYTGEVLEPGVYKLIYREFETAASYTFRDYFAPSGYRSIYMMRQQINLNDQMIESTNGNTAITRPESDGYWLILESPIEGTADVFKFNVNDDSFTDEQEESEFVVVGRGRVVNRGEDLGPKGTMTSKIRDSGTTGRTARQKRLMLLDAQKTLRKVWLRNPFGDVFRVSVSQMNVTRIAGVGLSEFCDVSIPYSKVGK